MKNWQIFLMAIALSITAFLIYRSSNRAQTPAINSNNTQNKEASLKEDKAAHQAESDTERPQANNSPKPMLDVDQFRAVAEVAMKQLPKIGDIKALPSHMRHRTPPAIIRAASAIGEIEEAIKGNTQLASEGQNFYGSCIKNQDIAKQIRVLCLYYAQKIEKNYQVPIQNSGVTDFDDLSDLASKL